MKFKKSIFLLLFVLIATVSLTSCKISSNEPINIIYYTESVPLNLDPQITEDRNSGLVLLNIMEGLITTDNEGNFVLGVAEDYEVSDDKMSYSFKIRDNLCWTNSEGEASYPLTANDFLYTFERLTTTKSNGLEKYYIIENFEKILKGEMDFSKIGISVTNNTITFKLNFPDNENKLFRLLANPKSLPCNKKFFLETQGEYGLTQKSMLYSGPYYLKYWRDHKIFSLFQSQNYYGREKIEVSTISIRLEESEDIIYKNFSEGESNVAFLDGKHLSSMPDIQLDHANRREKDIWGYVINPTVPYLQNDKIRYAIAGTLNEQYDNLNTPEWLEDKKHLIDERSEKKYDISNLSNILNEGLQEEGLQNIPDTSILYPKDDFFTEFIQKPQGQFQNKFGQFVGISPLERDEIENHLKKGDFDIAFEPILEGNENYEQFFRKFADKMPKKNPEDLSEADDKDKKEEQKEIHTKYYAEKLYEYINAKQWTDAEKYLIDSGYIIPTYQEYSYFVHDDNLTSFCLIDYDDVDGTVILFHHVTSLK